MPILFIIFNMLIRLDHIHGETTVTMMVPMATTPTVALTPTLTLMPVVVALCGQSPDPPEPLETATRRQVSQ